MDNPDLQAKLHKTFAARLFRQCGALNTLIEEAQDAGLDVRIKSSCTGSGIPFVDVEAIPRDAVAV